MSSLSARSNHISQLVIVFVLVTISFYYLILQDGYDAHDVYRVAVTGKKLSFVEDFLATDIDGPFNGAALAELCSTKKWVPGLIFKCESPQGSFTNVRNIFLNCVRYAIEAGATGFIVPEIMVRRPKDRSVNELHAKRIVPFTYYFDQEYFTFTLSAACPHMHIYSHLNDLWDKPTTASPVRLLHPQLTSRFYLQAESVMLSPANWTNVFKDHLNSSHPVKFSDSEPVLVALHNPLLQWPIDYEGPAFVASFGRLLRASEDVRRLAATVLYAMSKKYTMAIKPATPGIQEGKFYGAHLRTAIDAVKAGWTPYSNQSENYISDATRSNLPLIYTASDSAEDLLKFIHAANSSLQIQVTTKDLLLAEKGFAQELAALSALTLDQQSVVDYEVLLRASRFGGTWESSFAWNIAMRRHVAAGHGSWTAVEVNVKPGSKAGGTLGVKATQGTRKSSSIATAPSSSPYSSPDAAADAHTSSLPLRRPKQTSIPGEIDFSDPEESLSRVMDVKPGDKQGEIDFNDDDEPHHRDKNDHDHDRPGDKQGKFDFNDPDESPHRDKDDHDHDRQGDKQRESDFNDPDEPHHRDKDDHDHDRPGEFDFNDPDESPHRDKDDHDHDHNQPGNNPDKRDLDQPGTKAPSSSSHQLPPAPGPQSFSDELSTVFGDVVPRNHPGLAFALAQWP